MPIACLKSETLTLDSWSPARQYCPEQTVPEPRSRVSGQLAVLSKTRHPTAPNRQGNPIDCAHEVTSGHPAILIIVPYHRGHPLWLSPRALPSITSFATRPALSIIAALEVIVAASLVSSPLRTEQSIVLSHGKLYHRRGRSVPSGPRLHLRSSWLQSRSLHPRDQRRATPQLRSPLPHRRCQRPSILGLHGPESLPPDPHAKSLHPQLVSSTIGR